MTFHADVSANVRDDATGGADKAAGSAAAQSLVGKAAGVKMPPSPTLVGALEALPAQWKTIAHGLDTYYTAGRILPDVKKVVADAVASGLFSTVKTGHELYAKILNLVDSTARTTSLNVMSAFIQEDLGKQIDGQVAALRALVDNEVKSVMGMKAGAALAKSADPNVKAIAATMYNLLKSQQNPAQWSGSSDINPGTGSPGQDVRLSSSSVMSSNDTSKSGQRADMIHPVVDQFNKGFRKWGEENFVAEVKR
jgi:hypothetical protein